MNVKKKALVAGIVMAMLTATGMEVQTDNPALQSLCNVKKAEAGIGGLGGGLGGIAKKTAAKALNVDVDSLQNNEKSMMMNLYNSAVCYAKASINISEALGLDNGQRAQMQAALTNLQNNKTDLGSIKRVTEATTMDQKAVQEAANNLMNSDDKDKIEKANELIKQSKVERRAANKYKLLAAKDAGSILSGTAKALAKGGDSLGDKLEVVQRLSGTAKTAKTITDAIGNNHKSMTTALKTYEKKNNIADVSDEEAEKQMKKSGLIME